MSDFSDSRNAVAGDTSNNDFEADVVAEGDWNHIHTFVTSPAAVGTVFRVKVAPNCRYRKLYLSVYEDPPTVGALINGILRASFNGRTVFQQNFSTPTSVTPSAAVGQMIRPDGGNYNFSREDTLFVGKIGSAAVSFVGISPMQLYLTADEFSFEITRISASNNTGVFIGVKSMQAS